jgi:hypothetical protein
MSTKKNSTFGYMEFCEDILRGERGSVKGHERLSSYFRFKIKLWVTVRVSEF